MENKNPKNEKQMKKRSKAAKIVLLSILGCIGVMVIIILVNLIIGMAGGTGTQDGSILGLGFGTLFTVLAFLLLALVLAWLLTEPSFKKEEEVVVIDDRYSSYVKKAKTPRPLADKTGAKAEEKAKEPTQKEEKPAEKEKKLEEPKKSTEELKKPAEEQKKADEEQKKSVEEAKKNVEEPKKSVDEVKKDNKADDNVNSADNKDEKKDLSPTTATEPSDSSDSDAGNGAEGAVDEDGAVAAGGAVASGAAVAGGAMAATAAAGAKETVFVRYRRSYMSRLIQADDDLKAYYTDIKNKLLSYKDVHDRVSWDFESFNNGRKKLAKLNVKGKTLTVNLALDPATVDAKYYATDLSDKPKFAEVPTLMKVKSGRSVKYTLELIEKMMENEAVPQKAIPSNEAFDLTYRDNESLIAEGYIKAIYDKDVDPDVEYVEQEIDIEDFLKK